MARIRSVKPAFFESEKIAKRLPGTEGRLARLLFVGIWTVAEDATGVARGSAHYLKSAIFPYDDDVSVVDIQNALELLARGRFIVRFEREDQSYLWVRSWKENQRIDHPARPTLPEPSQEEIDAALSQSNGRLEMPTENPREERARPSRDLREERATDTEVEGEVEVEMEVEGESEGAGAPSADADHHTPLELQALWNKHAPPILPRWEHMPDGRKDKAKRALKKRPLLSWLAVIQRMHKSAFLRGEKEWKAGPDWLLKTGVAEKILEGTYDDHRGRDSPKGRATEADKDWSRPVEVDPETGNVVL